MQTKKTAKKREEDKEFWPSLYLEKDLLIMYPSQSVVPLSSTEVEGPLLRFVTLVVMPRFTDIFCYSNHSLASASITFSHFCDEMQMFQTWWNICNDWAHYAAAPEQTDQK